MSDVYMDILALPDIPKEMIFTYLEGGSLRNARAVCKEWNLYIRDIIWKQKRTLRILTKRLEDNWRLPDYIHDTNWIDTGFSFRGFAVCRSSLLVAFRTPLTIGLKYARISIYHIENKEFWEISHPFKEVHKEAYFQRFKMCLSDSVLAVRLKIKSEDNAENLQVFSVLNKKKILDLNIPHLFNCLTVNSGQHSELMVLITRDNVQLYNFKDEDNIVRVRIPSFNHQISTASFNFPFITQTLYEPLEDHTTVTVFEVEETPLLLTEKLHIENLDRYFHYKGKRLNFAVDDIIFVKEGFLVSCEETLTKGASPVTTLCLKFFALNGELIKLFKMPEFSPDSRVTFVPYQNERLLLIVDQVTLIYQGIIEDLFNKNLRKPVLFQRIPHLDGHDEVMLSKTEATCVCIVNFFGGFQMIKSTKLNFWKKN